MQHIISDNEKSRTALYWPLPLGAVHTNIMRNLHLLDNFLCFAVITNDDVNTLDKSILHLATYRIDTLFDCRSSGDAIHTIGVAIGVAIEG